MIFCLDYFCWNHPNIFTGQEPPPVVMVDELLIHNPHKLSFSEAGLRIMITPHFSPRTRLSMAGRMVISEVIMCKIVTFYNTHLRDCLQQRFPHAETEAHTEFDEPARWWGRTQIYQQQPEEDELLQPGERRQRTWCRRRSSGRQSRSPGVPTRGRGWSFPSSTHTRYSQSKNLKYLML